MSAAWHAEASGSSSRAGPSHASSSRASPAHHERYHQSSPPPQSRPRGVPSRSRKAAALPPRYAASSPPPFSDAAPPAPKQRRPRERREMDVKVLYTLESAPHSTMVAHLGRQLPVELLPARRNAPASTPRFGTVTLKTCLSAICIASPELVFDRRKDYTLYAQDPLESHRRRTSGPSNPSFVVGKGFFSWALAEAGEGDSMVTGVVRGTYEDDDEELEIVLRLKEAVKQSREQYYDLVRAFNPGASDEPAPQPAPDAAAASSSSLGKRKAEETDAPARYAPQRREQSPSRRSPATFTAPLPRLAAADSALLQAQELPQDATVASTQQQLLQLLQALQGQAAGDSRTAASPMDAPALSAAGARINEVLSQLTPAMSSVPLPASADSRRNSRRDSAIATSPMTQMTPGGGEDELRATSAEAEAPPANETAAAKKRRVAAETKAATQKALREARACYNCGIRGLRSWRFVHLPQGLDAVLYKDGSDVRETERGASLDKPQWRACNACGKYFTKTGTNRPQERVLGDLQGGPRGAAWRAAVAQNGPKLSEDSDEDEAEQPAEGLSAKRARSAGLPRTLSDVCERDSKRVNAASAVSRGAGPKIAETIEEARLKDFIKDADGRWRTKRSILENPQGLPPGRPKGCKTGEAKGRSAQRQRIAAARKAEELANSRDSSTHRGATTASSPNTSMSATFAHSVPQSSPVRPSLAARAVTDGWAQQQQHRSPAGFARPQAWMPTPRGRYGAPSYLLDSSPGTALQTLLSEGNDDWTNMAGQPPPTPLRRSPRKNPHGTRATYNPFASDQIEQHSSPTRGDDSHAARGGHDMTLNSADLMSMISTSPLTRGRVRSGNYELAAPPGTHPALWSSDGPSSANKPSSNATSPDSCPGSPSPSRKSRRLTRGVMGDASQQPGAHTVSLNQVRMNSNAWDNALGAGSTPADGGLTPVDHASEPASRRTHGRSPSQDRKAARQARAGHGGPGSNMGPFMGTEDAEMDDGGPCGSPTLGRATRRRRPAAGASLYGAAARSSDALGPASSPPMFSEADLGEMDEWGRTASMKEFFPTPSPVKAWTLGDSPDMATPADAKPPADAEATQQPQQQPPVIHVSDAPATTGVPPASTALVSQKNTPAAAPTPVNSLTPAAAASAVKRVGRRPLPATVEDAPSTSSASSPPEALSPDGEYEDAQSLFDMFDDPYGLLANSGLGANGNMQGISLETFDGGVELHPSFNFMQHLQQFTHDGRTGIAASVATGAVVTSAAAAAPAAASPSSPPRRSPITNGAAPVTPSKKTTAAPSAAASAAQRGELSPGLSALLNSFSATSNMGDPTTFALPNFSPSQFNFDEQTMKSMFASMGASVSPPRPPQQQRAAITASDESAPEQGSSAS